MRARRFKKSRSAKRVFLVICEGETEKAYIEALKQEYRLPIAIKTKVSGQSISNRLVNRYLNELDLEKSDDYRIFYVYDSDVEVIVNKLKSLPGSMILTNPCIELWFLLHARPCTRMMDSESTVRALFSAHHCWKNYSKGYLSKEQTDHLTANRHHAMERARALSWPANPSTNFSDFIIALENEKNS